MLCLIDADAAAALADDDADLNERLSEIAAATSSVVAVIRHVPGYRPSPQRQPAAVLLPWDCEPDPTDIRGRGATTHMTEVTAATAEDWREWLQEIQSELPDYPTTLAGPHGDRITVAYHDDPDAPICDGAAKYATLSGTIERRGGQVPIEVELAPGVVTELTELRVYLVGGDAE